MLKSCNLRGQLVKTKIRHTNIEHDPIAESQKVKYSSTALEVTILKCPDQKCRLELLGVNMNIMLESLV